MDRELARAEDGSWRVGLVDIQRDGALASYAGRHRVLTVVDGPVLALDVDGEAQVLEPHRPCALRGDATVLASVPEGAVTALDVVLDAAVVAAYVTVLELGRSSVLPLADDQVAHVVKGEGSGGVVVGPGEVAGRCTVAVVTLERG